jgi:hypothetical protein
MAGGTRKFTTMLFNPNHESRLDRLTRALEDASVASPRLVGEVIIGACVRLQTLARSGKAPGLEQMIVAGAWTDVALAIIRLELPFWQIRRLINEDGEWHCSLTRHPQLPEALDDMAEARHADLPLALLLAFIEARCCADIASAAAAAGMPRIANQDGGEAINCDSFC